MRAHAATKRPIDPDSIHRSKLVTQVINRVMQDGKKSKAERIVYDALAILSERTGKDPVEALEISIKALTPVLEVKSRRVGGATYQVPVEVPPPRARTLAVRWLVEFARNRREKSMAQRLANELLDAQSQQGGAFKRQDDIFRMAQANKAFALPLVVQGHARRRRGNDPAPLRIRFPACARSRYASEGRDKLELIEHDVPPVAPDGVLGDQERPTSTDRCQGIRGLWPRSCRTTSRSSSAGTWPAWWRRSDPPSPGSSPATACTYIRRHHLQFGTYAEYATAPEGFFAHMPPELSFEEAAALPLISLTAHQALEALGLRGGETLFLTGGAGGIGHVVISSQLRVGRAWSPPRPGATTTSCASSRPSARLRGRQRPRPRARPARRLGSRRRARPVRPRRP